MEVSFKIPRYAPGQILLVSLTFFRPEVEALLKLEAQNALEVYNQDFKRDFELVYALSDLTFRQKYLEEEKAEGSFKELFLLGSSARSLGWKTIVVADAITLNQVNERPRLGSDEFLNVVLIDTRLGRQEPPVARRVTLEEAYKQSPGFELEPVAQGHDATKLIYNGIPLYDPESPILSTKASSAGIPLVLKQLVMQKDLPMEVFAKIVEALAVMEVKEDTKGLLYYTDLSGGDIKDDMVLEVQVSERDLDLAYIEKELQASMTGNMKANLALFPYKGTGVLTRRKARQIFSGVCWIANKSFPMYDPKLWREEKRLISIGWSDSNQALLAHKVTIDDVIKRWHEETESYKRTASSPTPKKYNQPFDASDPETEFLAGPKRFFYDPPSWTTYGKGYDPHRLVGLSQNIPVETVTSAVSGVFADYHHLNARTGESGGMLVPWSRKSDGDLRDVYETWLSMLLTSWQWMFTSGVKPIFLDAESQHDRHAVVVSSVHCLYTRSSRPVFWEIRFKRVMLQIGRVPFAHAISVNEFDTPLVDIMDDLAETEYAGKNPPPMAIYDPRYDVTYDWDWKARAWRVPHKYIPRQDPSPFLYDPHMLTMDSF